MVDFHRPGSVYSNKAYSDFNCVSLIETKTAVVMMIVNRMMRRMGVMMKLTLTASNWRKR